MTMIDQLMLMLVASAKAVMYLQIPPRGGKVGIYLILLYDAFPPHRRWEKKDRLCRRNVILTYKSITRYTIITCQSLISLITL
jgi:hypothetical protein